MKTTRVTTAISDIQQMLVAARFNRGEVAGILAAILAHALREGIPTQRRREELLEEIIDVIYQLWAEADQREGKTDSPRVM